MKTIVNDYSKGQNPLSPPRGKLFYYEKKCKRLHTKPTIFISNYVNDCTKLLKGDSIL